MGGFRRFHGPAGRSLAAALLAALLLCAFALPALALPEENYFSYVYNEWGDAVWAPSGYSPKAALYGADLGAGALKAPRDLFVDGMADEMYIVDSGNNRIVVVDSAYRFLREYRTFRKGGEETALNNPGGVFVSRDGRLYICDTGNKRVLVAGPDGEVLRELGLPQTDLIAADLDYQPEKVVVDSAGRIYVQAVGVFSGLICMDEQGAFISFFGSNRVEMTGAMMVEYLWKQLLSREQRSRMTSFIPIEYSNVYLDQDDFIYAASVHSSSSRGEIKKLNALGVNVLHIDPFASYRYAKDDYGDHPVAYIDNNPVDSMFADIAVSPQGIITALDAKRGRVFQYDSESNLVTVFGGIGNQLGTFQSPSSLAAFGQELVVLDSKKNSLTVFAMTDFGKLLHTAIGLYNDGHYLEAMAPWREVLRHCANYNLAYIGLGKANLRLGNYAEAMRDFRLGYDKQGYSDALGEMGVDFGRNNLGWIFLGVVAAAALGKLLLPRARRRLAAWKLPDRLGLRVAAGSMAHPIQAMEAVKFQGQGSLTVALLIVALWFVTATLNRQAMGFLFNPNRPEDVNLWILLMSTVGLYALWVMANIAATTFMNGEGKPLEVAVASAYALQPYLYLTLAALALSHGMTLETGVFLTFLRVGAVGWSAVLMAVSLMTVHQFTFKKTLVNLLATALGMVVIGFLIALVVSMFQQLQVFFYTIFNEVVFRL